MEYFLLFIAFVILYSQSAYFPIKTSALSRFIQKNFNGVRIMGYATMLLSVGLFILKWGTFTGLIFFLVTTMFVLLMLLISVPFIYKLTTKHKAN